MLTQKMKLESINSNNERRSCAVEIAFLSTFKLLAFLLKSRPVSILVNLLELGILLIWDAAGDGTDPEIGEILSKELSSDCLIIFGFFGMC